MTEKRKRLLKAELRRITEDMAMPLEQKLRLIIDINRRLGIPTWCELKCFA